MIKPDLSKIQKYIKEDVLWKTILDIIPDDTILFFDIEVYPPVKTILSQEHKIIAIGVSYRDNVYVYIGDESSVLSWFNDFVSGRDILLTVGYGSIYLDIPLLLFKLRKYRTLFALRKMINKVPHLDMIYFTSVYLYSINKIPKLRLVSLKDALELLGIGTKQFSEEIYSNKHKLRHYLENDIISIVKLFSVLRENYFRSIV